MTKIRGEISAKTANFMLLLKEGIDVSVVAEIINEIYSICPVVADAAQESAIERTSTYALYRGYLKY